MTHTDQDFITRFQATEESIAAFVGNQSTLGNWTPTPSPINTGMLSDIGRAAIYAPDIQPNFYSKFMKPALPRGDSSMSARFSEVLSRAYDPDAADTALFNATYPQMVSNVAKKNLSRQIAVEINDKLMKQFCQTQEMIDDAAAAIMGVSNACYLDDMWVASKEYFSGSVRSAKATQMHTLTHDVGTDGFDEEFNELLWRISQREFGYKSTDYNSAGYNTKADSVAIAIKKDCEYPAFKKLLANTYNPEMLKIAVDGGIDYVDDFATPAGKPENTGELLAMVVDTRAFKITPMPDGMSTETFRNPARQSTAFFTTYEYAFQHDPFFDCAYIFAPAST